MAVEMRNTARIPPRCFRRRFRRPGPHFMLFFVLNDPRDVALVSFFILPLARPRARPRPQPRPRPRRGGDGGGLGLDVRVEVRRTEGRPPPSS